ncbi:hypothetical protein TCE0_043f15637 [Talaromyces pinophilus]|uniref:DUF676 domain-containing protein n=1 Tax=Talaromyces pinophilus TaxID=128442 RepID=A0A0B8MY91_TALPI|nr:hypothetical protein TCE0_043f15637 [Talaromyces pinophilus]
MTLPFAWSSIFSYRPLSHDCYRLLEEMGDSLDDNAGCRPDHLCVLVHGLWGNPSHLDYVASAIRERHGKERVYILAAQRNSGTYTYDGIELGGERVAHEIEDALDQLRAKGHAITKLSVVGYSLGGLVARYAIGLLEANGTLDKLEPVNFTTFVSPHVGVRSPIKGWPSHIWNVLGARTISISGRQLFMIDNFRGTGKPLLSLLADPNSIFIRGLAKFKNRSVYANIVNDRSTVFYTTAISKVDPFPDPEKENINYLDGYEQVIINPEKYILPTTQEATEETAPYFAGLNKTFKKFYATALSYLFLTVFLPIATVLFLVNSVVQNMLSQQRIKLYEQGKTDLLPGRYRVPLIMQDVRGAVEDVFENLNASQSNEYLSEQERNDEEHNTRVRRQSLKSAVEKQPQPGIAAEEGDQSEYPLLALTPAQFEIIDSLNAVGIKKYPVYIHKARHSHAAIIVRMPKPGFSEGKIVVRHWLDHGFEV